MTAADPGGKHTGISFIIIRIGVLYDHSSGEPFSQFDLKSVTNWDRGPFSTGIIIKDNNSAV